MQRSKVPEDFLSLAGACWQERTFPMQKFYRLSVNIVKILTLLLAVFLFIGSFLTTCYAENMETQQVLLRFDNPLWNLPELAGYGLLFACCLSLSGKAGAKFRRGLLVFTLGLILLLGGVLIVFGRTVPAADALSVYNAAAEWILGNKDIIHPTVSYLSYYPQQIGLMAFLELLLRLWNLTGLSAPAWHFVKLVYVCLLCVAVLFQYRSLRYLWPDDWEPVSCCYLILVCCNLPMILYSSFVYGEIPSFAMLSVGLFLLLKLLADCIPAHSVETTSPDGTHVVGTSHALSAVTVFTALGSILFLTLSVMLRKNSLILIIAVLLVLFFEALRPGRSGRACIGLMAMAVCLSITSVGVLPLVQKCYEKKAGNTLSSGVTAVSYFAMGMQESSRGCGWYNGFNIDTYDAAGMNSDAANAISRAAINERIAYFREHPGYAVNFYLHKHLSQWADGTYASRQATLATYGGRSDFLKEVYEGSLASAYIEWGNAWQNVLYLGMLLFCIATVRKRRPGNGSANAAANDDFRFRSICLYTYTGLIAVLGGFLFHTIWEANSRYIFVYSLLLMPYCAAGIHDGLVRLAAWRSNRTLTRHSNS